MGCTFSRKRKSSESVYRQIPEPNEESRPFRSPCLAEVCPTDKTPTAWFHFGCGGAIRITRDGLAFCLVHRKAAPIDRWRVACKNHPHDLHPVTFIGLYQMVNIMRASCGSSRGEKIWHRGMAKSIIEMISSRNFEEGDSDPRLMMVSYYE